MLLRNWHFAVFMALLLVSVVSCNGGTDEQPPGLKPSENCGCPPVTRHDGGTYGIYAATGDKDLLVDLQGWSRIGISEGGAPDKFGYLPKDGRGLKQVIRRLGVYGTRVDVVIDLGKKGGATEEEGASGSESTGEKGVAIEPDWLGEGRGSWVEKANSFSIVNLAEDIEAYVKAAGCDGVLLRFPMAYIGDYFNTTATGSDGRADAPAMLPRQRVMNLIFKLKKMETFKSRDLNINLYLTDCEYAKDDSVLNAYLEKLLAGVDTILLDMGVLKTSEASPKLNKALWKNYEPLVSLKEGKRSKIYHVMDFSWFKEHPESEWDEPMAVAGARKFGGLAMELTEESKSVFRNYNRKRLEKQDDFFAKIVWKSGLGNALCSKRRLIKLTVVLMGCGLLSLAASAWAFWPVCEFLGRFYYLVITACLVLVGLIWLYEAVNPTENNWTNETVAGILVVLCVVFLLVWLRNWERARFP